MSYQGFVIGAAVNSFALKNSADLVICRHVSRPNKLSLCKRTAAGEEGHPQDQAGVSQQKSFLGESNLSELVLERKTYHGHRDCYGYRDRPGRLNRHGYFSIFLDLNRQGSCRKVASLISVIDAQVAKTVSSFLEAFRSFFGSGHLVA